MNSYKTTIGGFLMVASAIIDAATKLYNNEAVNWEITIGLLTGGLAMMQARDNKVSDQQAGARPEVKK